ncbi:uncharacterized protein DSM5745_09599 [Aspergillus mulundensis]|uniref:Leucine rich repeat protein n=1 Tax=Aspergillus mulundensis TaxID=1810919 RepID=A0A3D8QW08_9EURO|nr:Uncharacterized protein DSM5745_09599 [Aspergillus mulundensis]RDW65860.1 Uncharacterized protein DSM5745_09599 [Aspergillus mulundensis]
MGRLTYSARKIGGIKAGQVVSKDLKKRIPPGIGSKAAARDPTLEIDLTGKCLTDEGFSQFIDDLIECVRYRDEAHPVGLAKVTEFHLQGNNLTVHSMAKLGEIIAKNPGDLRELDLSNNDIRVVTAEEKDIWKSFLCSFKNCYVLTKLDISRNPLGVAGLEILANVYIKSDLEYLEADADAIVRENLGLAHDEDSALAEEANTLKIGENSSKENSDPRSGTGRSKKSPNKGGKTGKQNGTPAAVTPSKSVALVDLKKYACTRGLRSVPYFILSSIELENSSAIHLSRILATQRASEQLLTFLPPGKASAIPEAAEEGKSIIWLPNNSFAATARRLLDVTVSILAHKAKDQVQEASDVEGRTDEEDEDTETDEDTKRKMQGKLALELKRLTKRVQLEALKQEGVHASDIGITALKMMVVSRALLLEDKDRFVENLEPGQTQLETETLEGATDEEQVEHDLGYVSEEEDTLVEQSPSPVEYLPEPQYTFSQSFAAGPFLPGAKLFDEEFPALQSMRQERRQPQPSAKPVTPEPEIKETLAASPLTVLTSSPGRPASFDNSTKANTPSVTTQPTRSCKSNVRGSGAQKARKQTWRFGLPTEIWRRIIAEAVGAEGVLDQEQQQHIMQYAADWDAVAYELTIKGAEDHQQIWKFLHTVGCLTYSPLT